MTAKKQRYRSPLREKRDSGMDESPSLLSRAGRQKPSLLPVRSKARFAVGAAWSRPSQGRRFLGQWYETLLVVTALALGLTGQRGLAAVETAFGLPAPPLELVTDEAKFRGFAETVRGEVERLLGVPAALDDPATFNLLLSSRVHLAHYFGDDEKAVATAAWIRSLQSDPALRLFAGLTTLAAVEARRQNPGAGPETAKSREIFLREFTRQLADLPKTPAVTAMLRGQREKIASLTRESLLAETRDVIIPAIARRGHCSLAEADQLVRVRHRLVSILPVKTETLQALEAAIAARPTS